MIDGRNFFDQPVKDVLKTNNNIQKIGTGQEDDYTTGCLLDYPCFKEHYKLIAIDLSKPQALDTDPKAMQKIILLDIQIKMKLRQSFSLRKKLKKHFRFSF